jgi:hydroxymethylglutaryl-CoA lyase
LFDSSAWSTIVTDRIVVTDVGPRDGLQNEDVQVATQAKIDLIQALAAAGVPHIEATAFVHPRWVPQLADATEVLQGIDRIPGTVYSALVPNVEGLERALAAGVDKVSVFTAASETFSRTNTNASIDRTLERFTGVFELCAARSLPIRAYVSTAVRCPFEGDISPSAVAGVVERLLAMGPCEIDLGDTIGVANPDDIDALLDAVGSMVPVDALVLHLHDTNGGALHCVRRAIERGVRRFDAACAGLGGCPYAPGAPGNLATEALLGLCAELGLQTGIDAQGVAAAGRAIRSQLNPV